MELLERHGKVRTMVVENTRRATLQPRIRQHLKPGTEVFTDALASYAGLESEYVHGVIDHAECDAKGQIHTNGLENFWSLTKRAVKDTYVAVEPFHLFRYLDEQSFRFNARKSDDSERFHKALKGCKGRKLTYTSLTGKNGEPDTTVESGRTEASEGATNGE